MIKQFRVLTVFCLACCSSLTWAHPGHDHSDSLSAGVLHMLAGVGPVLFLLGAGLLVVLYAPFRLFGISLVVGGGLWMLLA